MLSNQSYLLNLANSNKTFELSSDLSLILSKELKGVINELIKALNLNSRIGYSEYKNEILGIYLETKKTYFYLENIQLNLSKSFFIVIHFTPFGLFDKELLENQAKSFLNKAFNKTLKKWLNINKGV